MDLKNVAHKEFATAKEKQVKQSRKEVYVQNQKQNAREKSQPASEYIPERKVLLQ